MYANLSLQDRVWESFEIVGLRVELWILEIFDFYQKFYPSKIMTEKLKKILVKNSKKL